MFKLFKDLTRPPEPLTPAPQEEGSSARGTRSRSVSINTLGAGGRDSRTASVSSQQPQDNNLQQVPSRESEPPQEDEDDVRSEELGSDAAHVRHLVLGLDEISHTMAYVETFSQLLSVPATYETRHAFRRAGGFAKLEQALHSLAWRPRPADISEEEWVVFEVQRAEGLRLWFETLAWATSDREGAAQFEAEVGYGALADGLRRLSPGVAQDKEDRSSEEVKTPAPEVLGLLLSHIFDNNYTLRSCFADAAAVDAALSENDLSSKLGDVLLRRPDALPLLWSYVWGLDSAAGENAPEKDAPASSLPMLTSPNLLSGQQESGLNAEHVHLFALTVRILTIATESEANAAFIRQSMPGLPDFLLTRIYGWEQVRHFDDTFPAREEWFQNAHAEDQQARPEWLAPSEKMREAYLAFLRSLLRYGVSAHFTWRLVQLVRKVPPTPQQQPSNTDTPQRQNGTDTPQRQGSADSSQRPSSAEDSQRQSSTDAPATPTRARSTSDDTPSKPFRGKTPLKITVPSTPAPPDETIVQEVLELIQIAMRSRNPSSFVFRGAQGNAEGGLEIPDLGRLWPAASKGFLFSSWVRISTLNGPITLLHLSQTGRKYPLLQVRVLENSQIGITTTAYEKDSEPEPEEVVSNAADALIPHNEWVHFVVGCRKGRGGVGGEARLFVNGRRVGAVRIAYPVPRPAPKISLREQQQQQQPQQSQQQLQPQQPRQLHHRPAATEEIRISVGRALPQEEETKPDSLQTLGLADPNDWMLGRSFMMEDVVPEDLVQLMYRLGPRYYGSFQEALGKFLTYENSTAINIYLHSLATAAQQKAVALLPANSALVRAIAAGPAFPESDIIFSLAAKDDLGRSSSGRHYVLNGAIPHISRARDFKFGRAQLVGNVAMYSTPDMDATISSAGGCVVVLKLVDLSRTSEELRTTLSILEDMLRHGWKASEEMERIYGFELLAAILRPKMPEMVNVACAKIILSILGVDTDDTESATVSCSAGYRAIALNFELWAKAPLDVLAVFMEHFDLLLNQSKHKRYNVLRTFQKSNIVRKLLYAIRSGFFAPAALPLAVDTLMLALGIRWSAEDAIKPLFSYLVSALCQNAAPAHISLEPSQSQLPAALILEALPQFLSNAKRLVKLNKAIALHRLLVIFLQSNPAPYVAVPCLHILALCLSTPGVESFQKQFESEGGFALLARTLAPLWDEHIQITVFDMIFGSAGPSGSALACAPAIASPMAALELLLQAEGESGSNNNDLTLSVGSLRSLPTPAADDADETEDNRLEQLLLRLAEVYRQSSAFRRAFTVRRIEAMLPSIVDFAAMSASSTHPRAEHQRIAVVNWLSALINLSKAPANVMTQLKAVVEMLKATLSPESQSATLPDSPRSPAARPSVLRRASSGLANSFTSPLSSSPTSAVRRRPSTDAGTFPALTRAKSKSSLRDVALRRTLSGESILREEQDKNAAWRMIIISTDARKFSAMTLDRKEHWHRLSQTDWPQLVSALRAENGVWADDSAPVLWRLDGSEGPLRMRSKLERHDHVNLPGSTTARHTARDAIPAPDELSSAVSRIGASAWEDPFALALNSAPIQEEDHPASPAKPTVEGEESEDESFQDVEDGSTNKLRLVEKALQAGDTVEVAHNIVRIVGVDALPGLLILGKRNLYLIDGLVQTAEGQVVEADQAPRDILSIPSGTLADLDPDDQRSHRWPYSDVVETNRRAFLFRDVALELYFADKLSFLIVFKDQKERSAVVSKMSAKMGTGPRSVVNSILLDAIARAVVDTRGDQLDSMTRKWQSREISNFAYIQMLNQHANRTPNDVTQYPVFPWVLADYTSQVLDLTKSSSYRDLSRPMGALTEARKEAAMERYKATEDVGEPPFHYGTHYSSSMIVCGYMIRLSPFTEIFLALQGGTFDLADRLFSSVPKTWDSASSANRGDVRELIPEFFYSPTFLTNVNRHDFGKKQVTGDTVDNVVLPAWALGDPLLFVHFMREALESDNVSRHLPAWIDLTFGYKQRDPASFNCFHPLSYRGAVDLDKMKDENEKASSTAIIHNFGQTPRQIFKNPHPGRFLGGRTALPVGMRFGAAEHWQMLLRSILPIAETVTPIFHIVDPIMPEMKPTAHHRCRLNIPGNMYLTLQYGFADESIRIYLQETGQRLVFISEGIDVAHAAFMSSTLLITVSSLGVLTAWRLVIKGNGVRRGEISLTREATLRGHTCPVTCMAVSPAWSFVVTGAEDGTAMVWDMNRLRYTRTLQTPRSEPIRFISINESNGHIALASKRYLYMFSLNGQHIAATSVEGGRFPILPSSPIKSPDFTGGIAFLKREFLRGGDCLVIGVGAELAIYRCVPGVRRFPDQEVEPWRLVRQGVLPSDEEHGNVTAVRFVGETLYAAFKRGSRAKYPMYQWSLPDTNQRHVPESIGECMEEGCTRHFGLLEPRRHCGGCGGVFCGSHAVHVEYFDSRYCEVCRGELSRASALGLVGPSRAPSRAGSVVASATASRAGSRRPSVSLPSQPADTPPRGRVLGTPAGSRSGSRVTELRSASGAASPARRSSSPEVGAGSPAKRSTSPEGGAGPSPDSEAGDAKTATSAVGGDDAKPT